MALFSFLKKGGLPTADEALPGRDDPIPVPPAHFVNGHSMQPPFPDGHDPAIFGMGCFWGAERIFWQTPGVWTTAVGYAGGVTPNPTYEEVCSGLDRPCRGRARRLRPLPSPLRHAAQGVLGGPRPDPGHAPGERRGHAVPLDDLHLRRRPGRGGATPVGRRLQAALTAARHGEITTEIRPAPTFYYAEAYHQQYLAKVPNGYCGLGGTGVACSTGLTAAR